MEGIPIMTPDQLADQLTARLNGPHNDTGTAGAARLAAEAARFLNHATGPHAAHGLTEPATVDRITGNLADAAYRLPQLCSQLGDYLAHEFAAGRLADDYGRLPYLVVGQARHDLDAAARLADSLSKALAAAQSAVSGLHHLAGGEDR
jgi:hypothetical protein